MSKIKRNTKGKKNREFWEHADFTSAQVKTWPKWKRVGGSVDCSDFEAVGDIFIG